MRILGIDPGYDRLGIAVLDKTGTKNELIFSECFTTDKKLALPNRLSLVSEKIQEIITTYSPSVFAIETLYFSTNKKTATSVAEARGVLLSIAAKNKLEIHEYAPGTIKLAITGNGAAKKEAVIKMVSLLVKIKTQSTQDDELDAIAVALTASAILR